MSLLQAILMGVIQGLTEFLPVSSSGHLALFQILFHVNTDTGLLFSVLLHLGTLISIFVAFHKDVGRLIREGILLFIDIILNIVTFFENLFLRKDLPYRRVICTAYRKFVMLILVSTIPTGIIGIVDSDLVEMSETILLIPGACLIITGILLLIADRLPDGHKTPKHVTYTNAFMVGICQGLATLPGLSRSGTTITACLASGFDRKFAVKYSFLMSIPAVLGAAILEIKDCFGVQGAGAPWRHDCKLYSRNDCCGCDRIHQYQNNVSYRTQKKIHWICDLLHTCRHSICCRIFYSLRNY